MNITNDLSQRAKRLLRSAVPWLLVVALALFASCGDDGGEADGSVAPTASPGGPPLEGSLFANASFEEGEAPWVSLESWGTQFAVSDDVAHSGGHSAFLELRSEGAEDQPARVFGVVQEVTPDEFPDVVSGYYYVDRWEPGTPKQYMQFVVIVFGADNIPAEAAPATNHQIRYILAGVDSPPIAITNARFVMVGTGAPKQGEWVRFERNIREDFEQLWGSVPEGHDFIRILFEARWDERAPDAPASAADVYYDDLYAGPAPVTP
ncbi:MAG: hypothetical protein WEE64_11655 [Dehalococcoidia bacterium]